MRRKVNTGRGCTVLEGVSSTGFYPVLSWLSLSSNRTWGICPLDLYQSRGPPKAFWHHHPKRCLVRPPQREMLEINGAWPCLCLLSLQSLQPEHGDGQGDGVWMGLLPGQLWFALSKTPGPLGSEADLPAPLLNKEPFSASHGRRLWGAGPGSPWVPTARHQGC